MELSRVLPEPILALVRHRGCQARTRADSSNYPDLAQAVLGALLNKYAEGGLDDIESMEVLEVQPVSALGSVIELVSSFGGKAAYLRAIHELESAIYSA